MAILIGCSNGLYMHDSALHKLPCPLMCVTALACGHSVTAADGPSRLLWDGRSTAAIDPGVDSILRWRGHILTLSSETDCLTLLDGQTGQPVTLAPAGVCTQHMCLLPQQDVVAVCGGADGFVRLMALPALHVLASFRVPGCAARVIPLHGTLYVLCTVGEDDLRCLLCRISPKSSRCEQLLTLPGLPGAIAADHHGKLWIASGETLYRLQPGDDAPSAAYDDFGFITQLIPMPHGLLICDPVFDACILLQDNSLQTVHAGGVQCIAVR